MIMDQAINLYVDFDTRLPKKGILSFSSVIRSKLEVVSSNFAFNEPIAVSFSAIVDFQELMVEFPVFKESNTFFWSAFNSIKRTTSYRLPFCL